MRDRDRLTIERSHYFQKGAVLEMLPMPVAIPMCRNLAMFETLIQERSHDNGLSLPASRPRNEA